MDFRFKHIVKAPPEEVAGVLLDEQYQASLGDLGPLAHREVISQKSRKDGTIVRRIRCVLDIDIGAAKKFIGDGDPAWVEEAIWQPQRNLWEWEIHPEVAADLLNAEGTIELHPKKQDTIRLVTGEVRVKVPLYGGKVEGWIVDGLERAYAEEAARLAEWLA